MSLQAAIQAYRRGERAEARRLVISILKANPNEEKAWTLLMLSAKDQTEQARAIQHTLALNPQNPTALKLQARRAQSFSTEPAEPAEPTESAEDIAEPPASAFKGLGWTCQWCGSTDLDPTLDTCPGCGAPREKTANDLGEASGSHAFSSEEMAAYTAETDSLQTRRFWIYAAIIVLGGAGVLLTILALVWTRDTVVEVAGHSWVREIEIEKFEQDRDRSWCDRMPRDAYNIKRSRRKRGSGDNARYDDWCEYDVDRWVHSRTVRAEGNLSDPPYWPRANIANSGDCFGCEREGDYIETYTLHLQEVNGDGIYACDFDQTSWENTRADTRFAMKVGMILKDARCDTLRQQ